VADCFAKYCASVRGLRLPDPMLSRPGPLPTGSGWSFEVKWDGFRAIVFNERN